MSAHGNVVDHEYEIERDGDTVATVSKSWFRVRDTYGVEIAPEQDDALILAITVCMDSMAANSRPAASGSCRARLLDLAWPGLSRGLRSSLGDLLGRLHARALPAQLSDGAGTARGV